MIDTKVNNIHHQSEPAADSDSTTAPVSSSAHESGSPIVTLPYPALRSTVFPSVLGSSSSAHHKRSGSTTCTPVSKMSDGDEESSASTTGLRRRRVHKSAKESKDKERDETKEEKHSRRHRSTSKRSSEKHKKLKKKEKKERSSIDNNTTTRKSSKTRHLTEPNPVKMERMETNGASSSRGPKSEGEDNTFPLGLIYGTEDSKSLFYLACGIALILIGIVGTSIQLILYQPYVVCCIAGAVSLAAYGWTVVKKLGLIRVLLPPSSQEYAERVLRGTLFDFIYFDSGITQFFRKWARFLLLTMDLTEPEIAEVLKGMSPLFLRKVLLTQIKENFPTSLKNVLIPSKTKEDAMSEDEEDELRLEKTIYFDPNNPGMWNHNSIINLLCEKKRIKENSVRMEPPLRNATQLIITNRVSAPLNQLTLITLNAGSWLVALMSLIPLSIPAQALIDNKTDLWKFLKILKTNTKIQVCLLVTTSFTLVSYQLRKKYQWLARRSELKLPVT